MQAEGFSAYALTSAILAAHLVLLAFYTAAVRAMRKRYLNPEDAKLNKAELVEIEHADVQRVKRAHQNALENAVPFFVIGALYLATGATKTGAQIYCYTFLGARLLHSLFYVRAMQPFRTISFAIGALAVLGMVVHIIRAVI
jgi:uncharacterized MAPEG superfamily protein